MDTRVALGQAEPSEVRAVLGRLLQDREPIVIATAQLLTTEIVSNAIRYGGGVYEVVVSISGTMLCVKVTDGTDELPVVLAADPSRLRGRGLRIVDQLATTWTVTRLSQGKVVSFELDLTGPRPLLRLVRDRDTRG